MNHWFDCRTRERKITLCLNLYLGSNTKISVILRFALFPSLISSLLSFLRFCFRQASESFSLFSVLLKVNRFIMQNIKICAVFASFVPCFFEFLFFSRVLRSPFLSLSLFTSRVQHGAVLLSFSPTLSLSLSGFFTLANWICFFRLCCIAVTLALISFLLRQHFCARLSWMILAKAFFLGSSLF